MRGKTLDSPREGGGQAHANLVLRSARLPVENIHCMSQAHMLTDSGQLVLRVCQPVPPLREELEGDWSIPEDNNTCNLVSVAIDRQARRTACCEHQDASKCQDCYAYRCQNDCWRLRGRTITAVWHSEQRA